jgi:hypothetical protein
MHFKLGSHKSDWKDIRLQENATEVQKSENMEDNRRISQFISDILLSENLTILTGLGTSLSATKPGKKGQDVAVAPKMSDLWSAVKSLDEKNFEAVIQEVRYDFSAAGENIELLLSRCQLYQKLNPSKEMKAFISSAEEVVVKLCDFVDDTVKIGAHEMFLRKVARRGARLPRTQIFTTNYDLCFEKAASRSRFIMVDGFSSYVPPEFDGAYFNYDFVMRGGDHTHPEFIPNVFQLHKLHGSIDWEDDGGVIRKTSNRKKPCIIYPQDGKYESSYSTPYLELMGRFQSVLRKQSLGIIIVGFGFNDNHISHPFLQALKSNVHAKILIVDPTLKTTKNRYLKQIESLAESGDWRIGMLSGTFEDLASYLPDIQKESALDMHYKRVREAI